MLEEFQDPLANYDPKDYSDPVDRALAEEPVTAIHHTPFCAVPPDMPIEEAINLMASKGISCLLVEEDDKLIGVFSERDALMKVALDLDALADRPISEFMTPNPIYVDETSASASALCVMAVSGYRHVPIIDLAEKIKGIVSPQRVTEFLTHQLEST